MNQYPILCAVLALTACGEASQTPTADPGAPEIDKPAIVATPSAEPEAAAIHVTGTEPFWGGEVEGTSFRYSTPENPTGELIKVSRFEGKGGVSFSADPAVRELDLTITPGDCNDGMSDRRYPFTATLLIAGEVRKGCAWSDAKPFSGPTNP